MTIEVQRAFGVNVSTLGETGFSVPGSGYRSTEYSIEPDASAASYFFAAAVLCGGRVKVSGLPANSLQGDAGFVEVLKRMGATVKSDSEGTEVSAGESLVGVDVDLRDLSDTAPTLAIVATAAKGPTRLEGIGFIPRKGKRPDRRCGPRIETLWDSMR